MSKKPGPKPNYGQPMLVTQSLRMTPDQRALYDQGGTPNYWREVIQLVASYNVQLNDGKITREQYEEMIGRDLAQATITHGKSAEYLA